MICRFRPRLLAGVALSVSLFVIPAVASAANLPPVRTSASNAVAECATPGRLMAFLKERNPQLDSRYSELGSHYMRHGEALGVRWDYAFFQMILETGHLTYKGDVKADQNNFAGLGATGKGARGERFPDISTGVRAHLEHVVMYSGERVENPVAERTRNIQDWGVLTSWQKGFSRPITYTDLAKKWAPGSRRYTRDIQTIATRFFEGPCRQPDPMPDLVAEIRGTSGQAVAKTSAPPAATVSTLPSAPEAKPDADVTAKVEKKAPQVQTASMTPSVTLLNPSEADEPVKAVDAAVSVVEEAVATADDQATVEVAALPSGAAAGAAGAPQKDAPSAKAKGSCRVWTASYGGSKAIIIKAVQDTTTNYTVLDVNEGAEKREADAYINAYAKGGTPVGEFSSQTQALEKAFELCPEG